MQSQILLTGGTGFFGKSLLRYFVETGMSINTSICILSRNPDKFKATYPILASAKGLHFLRADIEDRKSLPWGQKFSHVLHAATDSTIGPKLKPLNRFNQIVVGTSNLLDLAVDVGARKFLLTSSGGIYGPQPADLDAIPEGWSGCPPLNETSSAYSQAKRVAEHLCSLYAEEYNLQTVIARCFAFVGPDLPLNVHFAIGNFIQDAFTNDTITVSGDGSPLRTYLDQRDLALWLFTLLQHGIPGETYNVGSDEVISIAELANLVRDIVAPEKSVHILRRAEAKTSRNRYVPDIRKICNHYDLKVTIPLSESIRRTASSCRNGFASFNDFDTP
jgi:dTDP-glucose 4,6-dehydratase